MPSDRELITEVFGCPIYNCYVCRECGTVGFECTHDHKMHINSDSVFVEFQGKNGPVEHGQIGEILLTDLFNLAMPLIRYRIGDLGIPLAGSCDCGRRFPFMDVAAGRASDFLISPVDGSYISGVSLCLHLLIARPEIGRLQIIQHSLNRVEVKIAAVGAGDSSESEWLRSRLKKILGQQVEVVTTHVKEIPKEKSGKYRVVISKVSGAERG